MGIQSISRELKSRITFPSLILDDFYIKEFEYSGSLLTKDEFEIGTAPAMRLKIKLIDDTGALKSYNFENKECNAEIGINTIIDGDITYQNLETYTYQDLENRYYDTMASKGYDYHSLGLFTVEKAVRVKDTITLECIDRMYKAEVPYVDNLTYPATVLQVFQRACSISGLSIASTVFANADYVIPYLPVYENVSVRKILASVAELAGGYAIINKLGQIEIITLEKSIASADINKDTYINLKFDEVAPAYIDKVIVKVGDEESTAGTGTHPYTVLNNILVQTPSNVVTAIYDVLNGLNYSPVQVKWQGDWTLNFGDRVSIDDDEVIRYSYLFDRKITYRGGVREEFKAPNKSDLIKNSTGKGSLTLDVNQIKTEIKIISGEIDQVISDTEGNFTQINQDIDSISNRVGTAEGDIAALELTAQGLALDVAAADGRALNAQATANAVEITFKSTGGMNYVENGKFGDGINGYDFYFMSGTGSYNLSYQNNEWTGYEPALEMVKGTPDGGLVVTKEIKGLTPGKTYTVGCLLAGHRATNLLRIVNQADSAIIGSSNEVTDGYGGSISGWQIAKITFVATDSLMRLRFYCNPNATNGYLWAKHVRCNEGTELLPYSQHPNEAYGITHKLTTQGYEMKDSNGEMLLTPNGVANEQNIGRVDNIESGYPMKVPFHIGSEVSQIRQAVLKWDMSSFRTYSKGSDTISSIRTTPSGGGGTTGTTWSSSGVAEATSAVTAGTLPHQHTIALSKLAHSHTYPNHTHSVDISHGHAPVFGILEVGLSDNLFDIYVDGVYRASVGATRGELDLSSWITTNGWHVVELHTATLKRIDANLFIKTYIRR